MTRKLKVVKATTAKAMCELADTFSLSDSQKSAMLKRIEQAAAMGSYYMNWYNMTYNEARSYKDYLEEDGFKVVVQDPLEGEDFNHYGVLIKWGT